MRETPFALLLRLAVSLRRTFKGFSSTGRKKTLLMESLLYVPEGILALHARDSVCPAAALGGLTPTNPQGVLIPWTQKNSPDGEFTIRPRRDTRAPCARLRL